MNRIRSIFSKELFKKVMHKYSLILFGFGFGLYAFYLSFTDGTTVFHVFAMISGFMLAFIQADRNVYHDRLVSLFRAIEDLDADVDVERFDYTEYEITMLGKTGSSKSENEEPDQKTLDEIKAD